MLIPRRSLILGGVGIIAVPALIRAQSIGGQSGISAAISAGSNDPWLFLDGRLNASDAAPLFPHLLDLNSPATQTDGQTYTHRPPWKVVGVDYGVGPRSAYLPLKDPWPGFPGTTSAALDAGFIAQAGGFANITLNPTGSGKFVQHLTIVGGPGITIQGWDFSVHNLSVGGSTDGTLWSDCLFKWTAIASDATHAGMAAPLLSATCDTIQYCTFDSNWPNYFDQTNWVQAGTGLVTGFGAINKTILFQYCAFLNSIAETVNNNPSNTSGTTSTATFQNCVVYNSGMGYVDGTHIHGDMLITQTTGIQNYFNVNWCLLYQNATWNAAPYNSRTQGCSVQQGNTDQNTFNNNTCISIPTAYVNWFFIINTTASSFSLQNNYADIRGCGPMSPNNNEATTTLENNNGSVPGAVSGNISIVTGNTLN